MGVHQFGDAGCRIGVTVLPGRLAHGVETARIGQERIELDREPRSGALAVRDVHRDAHVDQGLGVARLVVARRARQWHQDGGDTRDQ